MTISSTKPVSQCENHKLLTAILQELTMLSRNMVNQETNLQKVLCVLQSSMLKMKHHFNKKMVKECVLKISKEPMIIPIQLQPEKKRSRSTVSNVCIPHRRQVAVAATSENRSP